MVLTMMLSRPDADGSLADILMPRANTVVHEIESMTGIIVID